MIPRHITCYHCRFGNHEKCFSRVLCDCACNKPLNPTVAAMRPH